MAVQLQWGLEQTSNSTIEIATGLMRAATTDNVQPLAILACEQFGNTLAISPEALRKVEHSVLPTPKPAIVSFLQSSVGYSANDCATQFGRNTAGLQFLAFATALITTTGSWDSGATVHAMLASSAKDKTLLPTLRQVRDLITSIEPRCCRAGLADDVIGWQILLSQSGHYGSGERFVPNEAIRRPTSEGIQNLVDALRQLRRIGNDDVTNITIRTRCCAPWAIAFIKWSLGYPPTVVLSDGTPILEQADSDIKLILQEESERSSDSFCVTIFSSIHGPVELVDHDALGQRRVTGMVTLKTYGYLIQQNYDFKAGLGFAAFQEIFPYALRQVIRRIGFHRADEAVMGLAPSASVQETRQQLSTSPFPPDWEIWNIFRLLFNQEPQSSSLEEDTPITDLPLMASYLAGLRKNCSCGPLLSNSLNDHMSLCLFRKTLEDFNRVLCDIFTLWLFERPESLRVSATAAYRYGSLCARELEKSISFILSEGKPTTCSLESVLGRALELAGHQTTKEDMEEKSWVMSSYKGQTVWATLYESLTYRKRGFLCLSWLPGVLKHKGDVYEEARGARERSMIGFPSPVRVKPVEVLRPCNIYPGISIAWKVSTSRDGLEIALGVRDNTGSLLLSVAACPWGILRKIANGLLVEECSHDSDSSLEEADRSSEFIEPTDLSKLQLSMRQPLSKDDRDAERVAIDILPVDGHQGLRFISMSCLPGKQRFLFRHRACLACCLGACRRAGVTKLVL